MQDEHIESLALWNEMVTFLKKLKAAKPTERSELARRYAVVITEYEKAMAYFNIFVVEGSRLDL